MNCGGQFLDLLEDGCLHLECLSPTVCPDALPHEVLTAAYLSMNGLYLVPLGCKVFLLLLSQLVEMADELGPPDVKDLMELIYGVVYVSFDSCSWSDISALSLSNCVSTSLTHVSCLLIGSSKEPISFLYVSKASSINA